MSRYILTLLSVVVLTEAINLEYLDPTKLQTITSPTVQQNAALQIISKYSDQVTVEVIPLMFTGNKDTFSLRLTQGQLHIRASTGVAAVWGFNYYLKKYCKSHIGWQVQRVVLPNPLPYCDEVVVANDRFRYYENVCTVSYSFAWWKADPDWIQHVEWMALNGINLALAPVAQEAAWARVYRHLGMTDDEIDEHFTGPAFLSWLRMGNIRGWGGPLLRSWHDEQQNIQDHIVDYMNQLGIIPVLPAFNGNVPKAFARIYPNSTFYSVDPWNKFSENYCCGLYLAPSDPLFKTVGKLFLTETTAGAFGSHIYSVDPFNELKINNWSTAFVQEVARAIHTMLTDYDNKAVWLVQNWMFIHDPILWPKDRVKAFLTAVPNGRMLVLDLQSEQWPQYYLYDMYFGQPFIWCMLHNFGGTLGMFGNMIPISKDVYEVRSRANSTMIGVGLTPEGINQNYVVYELMLESAWRKEPLHDLEAWLGDYAERRYGCNGTTDAWKYLLKSVYSFNGLNRMRGKYVITRRPSFRIRPWAWYSSYDLFQAFKKFALVSDDSCNTDGFLHDLVDVTRQALQYRAEQLYVKILNDRYSNIWVFNASISQFLDCMVDISSILATNPDFTITNWLSKARSFAKDPTESLQYEINARNQITLWGPNGEISDYACKQWAEMFQYYYTPRWSMFLSAALDAKVRNEFFDEKNTQAIVRSSVEEPFLSAEISALGNNDPRSQALKLYLKWAFVPDLEDLPLNIIKSVTEPKAMLDYSDEDVFVSPSVVMQHSTTPL